MRNRINGLAGGALWLVFITAVFAIFGLFMINTPDARWALVITVAMSLALTAVGIAVLRSTAQLPPRARQLSPDELVMIRRFWIVLGAEIVAFVTVNPLFPSSHSDMLPAFNIAIIGLHFIPLAWIFGVPRYYALGLHFCAIAAITLLVIPAAETFGSVRLWYVFPSLGVAPVVWAVAWGNLCEASRELSAVRAAQ
jgi:hypothetical protein